MFSQEIKNIYIHIYMCVHIQDIITYRWIITNSLITSFIFWIVKTIKRIFSVIGYIKNSQNSKYYNTISLGYKKIELFLSNLLKKNVKFIPDTTHSILALYKNLNLIIKIIIIMILRYYIMIWRRTTYERFFN